MSIVLKTDLVGGLYLDFDDHDISDLKNILKELFGKVKTIEKGAIFDRIEIGGEEFIYYYEWDPCLLPMTDKGSTMLRDIAGRGRVTQEG